MVFVNENWNDTNDIVIYSNYHKYWLDREHSIDKLAMGGNRDKKVHLNSITTLDDVDIQGDVVLLMDDVTTTGNSLYACKEILLSKGANQVEMFALGRAI